MSMLSTLTLHLDAAAGPRPELHRCVELKSAVGLDQLEGAVVVSFPSELLEVRVAETLAGHRSADGDQAHSLVWHVVHVSEHDLLSDA